MRNTLSISYLKKCEQAHFWSNTPDSVCPEMASVGPHNTSHGLHQGNKSWCALVKSEHESLPHDRFSWIPPWSNVTKWFKSTTAEIWLNRLMQGARVNYTRTVDINSGVNNPALSFVMCKSKRETLIWHFNFNFEFSTFQVYLFFHVLNQLLLSILILPMIATHDLYFLQSTFRNRVILETQPCLL